jgi:hypothetical protein
MTTTTINPESTYYAYPYGIASYEPLPQWKIHLNAFLKAPTPDTLSKYEHALAAGQLLWPDVKQNPWMQRCLKAFTNDEYAVKIRGTTIRTVVLSGCAGAGKTFSAGYYTCLWWLAAPHQSIAYFTSTSYTMIRRRVWPVIQRFGTKGVTNALTGEIAEFGGNLVDSKSTLQAKKGDDKHSIAALAVAQGDIQEAVAKLSGQHAERILLVIDEGQATPEGIYRTIPNLRKACSDLTIVVIENPSGILTNSGRASEPKDGWKSVGLETYEWRTKGVPEWQFEPGVCLRFDGADSPNVKAAEEAKVDEKGRLPSGSQWQEPHPYIYTSADWLAAQQPDREGTLSYWTQDRGLNPPEGTSNTIITPTLVDNADGYGKFNFYSQKSAIAFLDPGFGGDSCVLCLAEIGDIMSEDGHNTGRQGIQVLDFQEVQIDPLLDTTIERQITDKVVATCKAHNVAPHYFGLDATGIGRGVGSFIHEEWSPQIRKVEFGGMASNRTVLPDDTRTARELYDRFVTELWYVTRETLLANQLKGLNTTVVAQGCARCYSLKGRRISVEKKEDMKSRVGYSPDHFDALTGIVEVARLNGFNISKKDAVRRTRHELNDILSATQHKSLGWGEEVAHFSEGWAS